MFSGDYLRVAVMVEPPGLHNHRPDHTLRQWIRVSETSNEDRIGA